MKLIVLIAIKFCKKPVTIGVPIHLSLLHDLTQHSYKKSQEYRTRRLLLFIFKLDFLFRIEILVV